MLMHKALFFNANQFITLVLAYKTKYSLYLLRVCGVTVAYDNGKQDFGYLQ